VLAATLQKLALSPAVVLSGQEMLLLIELSHPAPTGGLTVGLQSSDSRITLPDQVSITAGTKLLELRILAPVVIRNTPLTVSASFYGTGSSTDVLVVPCTLSALLPEFNDLAAGA
jgi:hypothetical protein